MDTSKLRELLDNIRNRANFASLCLDHRKTDMAEVRALEIVGMVEELKAVLAEGKVVKALKARLRSEGL